jgi:hypothetical protein
VGSAYPLPVACSRHRTTFFLTGIFDYRASHFQFFLVGCPDNVLSSPPLLFFPLLFSISTAQSTLPTDFRSRHTPALRGVQAGCGTPAVPCLLWRIIFMLPVATRTFPCFALANMTRSYRCGSDTIYMGRGIIRARWACQCLPML